MDELNAYVSDTHSLAAELAPTEVDTVADARRRADMSALSIMLMQALMVLSNGVVVARPLTRGGLAGWQRKRVAEFIEAHLAEDISLTQLAELARLSPYHFARAFKQTFGMPPHRYHMSRRVERAKALLAKPDLSVTQIGFDVGFSESSSFSAAFRKFTGTTPSTFRRNLD
jgi:AraC family transcriptional regulator